MLASANMNFYTRMLLWMVAVGMSIAVPSWRHEPEDVTVQRGENATILCEIAGLTADTAVIWQNASQVLFVNNGRHHAPTRYTMDGEVSRGQFNLLITDVMATDDGSYQCSVPGLLKKAVLTVIVPPGEPQISLDAETDLRAGQTLTFSCASSAGNPAPDMAWYRNGQLVSGGFKTTKPSTKFGTTTSVLQWTLTRKDHGATFACYAENDGNRGNPVTVNHTVQVQYPPELWFTPPGPVRVLENDSMSIACVVDANPAVSSVKWLKNGAETEGAGMNYRIENADINDDSANYGCVARNPLGDASATIKVEVIYAPKLSIVGAMDGKFYANEFQSVNLSCHVQSSPEVTSVWWQKVGSRSRIEGGTLTLLQAERSAAGVYVCMAVNSLVPTGKSAVAGFGNATVELVIQYPPGQAHIEQTPKGYAVKGQEVKLTCDVGSDTGFPSAGFRWTRQGDKQFRHDGAELRLAPVTLDHSDIYTCTPVNSVGIGKAVSTQLVVNEEVSFVAPLLETVKYVSITETGVSVMCAVRGTPTPQVTWYKNGKAITSHDINFKITATLQRGHKHSNTLTSILQWRGSGRYPNLESLQIRDTANYTCLASNRVGKEKLRTVKLFIQYPPVVRRGVAKVAVDLNDTVSLVCQTHASPHPAITWYLGRQPIRAGGHIDISTSREQGVFTHQSVLKLKVGVSDLGQYKCLAANNQGSASEMIQLQLKTKPEAPANLQVYNVTWESATLRWTPGFNGGFPQSFVVVYTSAYQTPTQINVHNSPEDSTFRIGGLIPATEYTFMVFGRNQIGNGPSSVSVTKTTQVVAVKAPEDVHYNPNEHILSFTSASDYYCVRVLVSHDVGSSWQMYEPCAPSTGGSMKLTSPRLVRQVNVSLCLERRQDVCSTSVLATIEAVKASTFPVTMVIIIGAVCGVVIVALIMVLAVLCCRRYRQSNRKSPPGNSGSSRPTVVISPTNRGKPLDYFNTPPLDGAESNHSVDDPDMIPDTSHMLKDPSYVHFGHSLRPPMNQYVPVSNPKSPWSANPVQGERLDIPGRSLPQKRTHSGSNVNQMKWSSPHFSDLSGELNASRDSDTHLDLPVLSRDNKPDTHSHSSEESGYSTPTKLANRKIVHEIVV